ncbi:MAG: RNA repair domain-containing protein [Candidatus Thermoplasmatota archaeon]|nr:RNA repair domain-containing protein [Candidatus Thermoplasmatota archaeon]
MNKIRDILNALQWDKKEDISEVKIFYIDRGAVQDTTVITGRDIRSVHKTFIETKEAMIPHHRVLRIIYKNTVVFDRYQHI